jgi:biopolymer transport protein TolR
MKRRADHSLEVRAEINVTSLVDVAFTLLLIFIITAPILQGGIEVAVPQGQVEALQLDESTMIISVNRDGSIFLGESEVVDRATFASAFEQLMTSTQPERVWIKSDSATTWAATFDVISTVAATGVTYAIVGEERPRGR